jgi:hypothetical protein
MKTIYCVLRSGGKNAEYDERHVRWLKHQCDRFAPGVDFVCLTDLLEIDGVETYPLLHHWPGWWSKIELFRYDDVFYLDLDTVLLNDIRYMLELDEFHALRNFGGFKLRGRVVMGSGVMTWSRAPIHVYENFDPSNTRRYTRHQNRWGDQGYIYDCLNGDYRAIQDAFPNRVCSYKYSDIDQADPNADIVCFHGRPRPWKSGRNWVPDLFT